MGWNGGRKMPIEIDEENIWIYDIEVYPNLHTAVFLKHTNRKIYKKFVIHDSWDNFLEYIEFLETPNLTLVGFNNLHYDGPITEDILKHKNQLMSMDSAKIAEEIYKYSNSIINAPPNSYNKYWENQMSINHIDLLKMHHYDNRARRVSLKYLEFTFRWHKLQDLPFLPNTIIPKNYVRDVITYNENDVDFTAEVWDKSIQSFNFRKEASKKYNKYMFNYSDVKIGEYHNRITYEKNSGRKYKDFKDERTYRDIYHIKDLIPTFISFETHMMKNMLADIMSISFTEHEDFERIIDFDRFHVSFRKGGLHSKDEEKIVNLKEGHRLVEKDVGGMYPASIINNGYYPEHLGEEWLKGLRDNYNYRADVLKPKLYKLEKGTEEYMKVDSEQATIKLACNGAGFGHLGLEYSWQYDPLQKFKTTFAGQLSLLMLIEKFWLCENVELISANTDGVVISYPLEIENEVEKIHRDWEEITKYVLEDTFYDKIIYKNVNNYIASIVDKNNNPKKLKFKGKSFLIDKQWHMDGSQRIVYLALANYFLNDIPIEQTIRTHHKGEDYKIGGEIFKNYQIFDFLIGRKKSKSQKYFLRNVYGKNVDELSDKVLRYYISTKGDMLIKQEKNGQQKAVNKGYYVKMLMDVNESFISNYSDINYEYYINECRKIINPINKNTTQLESINNTELITYKQLNLFE